MAPTIANDGISTAKAKKIGQAHLNIGLSRNQKNRPMQACVQGINKVNCTHSICGRATQ